MISEASFATSVPAMPIEKPTSACLRAGPSLLEREEEFSLE